MTRPTCLNLRSLFGREYKIRHEESYRAERPEFRKEEEPWLQIIPCRHGHIYPHGGNLLGWSAARAGSINEQVKRLPFVTVSQDGSDGANVLFEVRHFNQVAAIVQPRRRPPKRTMTPEQRQAAIERLAPYQFATQKTNDLRGQGRVGTGLVDSDDQGGAL